MQIRWGNIIALGIIAFAVTLGLKLAPRLERMLELGSGFSSVRTPEDRILILSLWGVLIVGLVVIVKLLVQGNREE